MLQIKNISKEYKTGDLVQKALDDVSLNLRDNEFVAILGPSGSGKTTLLNIIGGLDRYDSGDLIINGISTKKYWDRDWDSYRNHTIGFVFQSYNLIQHQSVLSNVELALTISGISRSERKRRAKEALEKVGLGDQLHKKPNQMSGGQMQRVAIARALVNDPDILLADEPTGALDSDTSVAVMELLKEVANDRLVVMVTHNPDLAEQYATRIVKVRDGKILDDSNPCNIEETQLEAPQHKNMGRASMSFVTALSLSFNNLKTKKARTLLTAFAGSIGIIGIALILSLSNGVNTYIEDIQKETMSSYPITIEQEAMDLSSIIEAGKENTQDAANGDVDHDLDAVYSNGTDLEMASSMTMSVSENNLTEFKKYLDDEDSEIHQYVGENGIVYSYDTKFSVYAYDPDDTLVNTDGSTINDSTGMSDMMSSMMSMSSYTASNFDQLMPGTGDKLVSDTITDNYELLYGEWPSSYDEVILVLDQNNEISLTTMYELGLLPASDYEDLMKQINDGEEVKADTQQFSYEDICNKEFYLLPECDMYVENENGYFDKIEDDADIETALENAVTLKITGVIKPNEDSESSYITGAVGYTSALTEYLMDYTNNSAVVKAQEASPNVNILNGAEFSPADDEAKIEDAKTYLDNLSDDDKADMCREMMQMMYASDSSTTTVDTNGTSSDASDTTSDIGDSGTESTGTTDMSDVGTDASTASASQMSNMSNSQLAAALDNYIYGDESTTNERLLSLYDSYVSPGTYEDNMSDFGYVSVDAPSSIDIYTDSFEDKEFVSDCIDDYNADKDEDDQITYTDYVGLLMSSITTIINVISYVLIAFVAVSLVVSSIMIGIITYISVLERTKEIGILRAIGASKHNISQVFNAETFIIGLISGMIGIGISLLLLIPANAIIHAVAGTTDVNAALPPISAVVLIVLSVLLTLLGGLIPSKKAAKKDPVTALRTE